MITNILWQLIQILGGIPESCITHLDWAVETGKFEGSNFTDVHYADMVYVVGIKPLDATRNDFQRYFKCRNIHSEDCNDEGLQFPKTCSVAPCNQCNGGIDIAN